jgi:hypothetical protein
LRRALAVLLLVSCGPPEAPEPDPDLPFEDRPTCHRAYTSVPPVVGNLPPGLEEVSGIAASPTKPGLLWMHADSGNDPILFALRDDGTLLGRVLLEGVDARDLEDIAAARCPDGEGFCLFLADTGDNNRERDDVALLILPEPEVDPEVIFADLTATPAVVPVTYPGGEAIDVEALAVTADGQRAFLFEKVDAARARAFSAPVGPRLDLELLLEFDSPGVAIEKGRMITAADLHPSGQRLVLRVYTGVFEYLLDDAGLARLEDTAPVTVTLGPLDEPQGETIAYDFSGVGLWSASEDPEGDPGQPLHHYLCDG